jgi:hypothetical protein
VNKPDSQQIGLAGEYYVAFILTRLGYDIGITIGMAKVFDMVAIGDLGRSVNVQVKSTYQGYDWLVKEHSFDCNKNSVIALVRLGKYADQEPELYFAAGSTAKTMTTHEYVNHSPRISRSEARGQFENHDFNLLKKLLEA